MIHRCIVVALLLTHATIHGHVWGEWKRLIKENSKENCKLTIKTSIDNVIYISVEKLESLDGNELAEVFSGQYQGDMIISEEGLKDYRARKARNDDLIDTEYRWDDGIVPYQIVEAHFSNQSNGFANRFNGIRLFSNTSNPAD